MAWIKGFNKDIFTANTKKIALKFTSKAIKIRSSLKNPNKKRCYFKPYFLRIFSTGFSMDFAHRV